MMLLDVKNLQTSFFLDNGELKAVDDISFSIEEKETLAIVGESGCGKTVVALSILNLMSLPGRIIGGQVNLAARLESNADVGGILLAAETYSLVKDWLQAEEQEAIHFKGFPKPIRTFSVQGIYDELAKDERLFRHEAEGVTITINGNRADKVKTKEALQRALAQLDE